MNETPFRRETEGRWIAGVCAGIARRQGWNANGVRLAAVVVTVLTGVIPGAITYLLAWAFVPAAPGTTAPPHGLHRSATDRKVAGVLGGLAESTGTDPTLLRLLAVFGTLATAVLPAVLVYLAAWLVLPLRAADATPAANA